MLGTLCTLITALTCVSGVTVVTQKPPVATVRKGETATLDCNLGTTDTLDCNLGTVDNIAGWYKQVPGGVPQCVLRWYHTGWSSVDYGSGFSSHKFTSNHQSKSDYCLIINNVEETDSAVYYCQTQNDSPITVINTVVFGQGTKLFVTDSTLPPPVLTIFPPSSDELKSSKVTLVCLASQMAMGYADVSWTAGGNPVTGGIATSGPVPQADKTFQLSSCLTVDTSEWNQDKVFSCKVTAGSKFAEKGIKKSVCSTE
ncbi:immunoglobulin lambda-1 light chain-like [Salvelinus namaycush]|uniref:immunoglobulin lambda-1 light chain-like n=1 Tax=Salvelinus namaycush TaxID=8040 RepID=UPI00190234E1|nr:immunoglobulin lambda-1 light chain-like [Salvelinus namaycush]